MTDVAKEWRRLTKALVASLVEAGDLRSQEWIDAFTEIPRHVFVPRFAVTDATGRRELTRDDPEQVGAWLSAVYSDEPLVIQEQPHAAGYRLSDGRPFLVSTSSSTLPSLMARMLEALDLRETHRVLEIGTGTGYNAALLSHRLGAANVVSIDIDPDLVKTAGDHLAGVGHRPTLVAGDGADGAPDHGPYDRIIATAAVPAIPVAWIEQLAPAGKILANLRGDLAGGALCLLTKEAPDEVIGPILPIGGHFMWLRPELDNPHRPHELTPPTEPSTVTTRTTTGLDLGRLTDDPAFLFLLQLQLHGAQSIHRTDVPDPRTRQVGQAVVVSASDGSRAEAFTAPDKDGSRHVVQHGPRRLWDTVEATHRLWHDLGQPTPDQFGVVANRSTQFVWFTDDDSWYRWPLPLV